MRSRSRSVATTGTVAGPRSANSGMPTSRVCALEVMLAVLAIFLAACSVRTPPEENWGRAANAVWIVRRIGETAI
eukprot:scaffold57950_cov30-Tisochrysis_lutea.AAC.5